MKFTRTQLLVKCKIQLLKPVQITNTIDEKAFKSVQHFRTGWSDWLIRKVLQNSPGEYKWMYASQFIHSVISSGTDQTYFSSFSKDFFLSSFSTMVFSKGNVGLNGQNGLGNLDIWVQRAEEAKAIIPNNQTTRIHLPPDLHIISEDSFLVEKYKLITRRLEVRSHGDVQGFIEELLRLLLQQVDPDDRVAMSISSEEFPKEVCHISFKKAKYLNYEVVLKAIKAMIQSGTLNEHFLDMPVRIVFHRCEGVRGRKRKVTEDLNINTKRIQHIVRVRNDDAISLARALVLAMARKKKEEDPLNRELARRYQSILDSRQQVQKKAAIELITQAGIKAEDYHAAIEKFQAVIPYQINVVVYERNTPSRIYKGSVDRPNIYLLNTDGHFDVVTKMEPFFGTFYFCDHCFKGFDRISFHHCKQQTSSLHGKSSPK